MSYADHENLDSQIHELGRNLDFWHGKGLQYNQAVKSQKILSTPLSVDAKGKNCVCCQAKP